MEDTCTQESTSEYSSNETWTASSPEVDPLGESSSFTTRVCTDQRTVGNSDNKESDSLSVSYSKSKHDSFKIEMDNGESDFDSNPVKDEIKEEIEVEDFSYNASENDRYSNEGSPNVIFIKEEGTANTSGLEMFSGIILHPDETDHIKVGSLQRRKRDRGRRKCKLKRHDRTEEDKEFIRQRNREQKLSRKQALLERLYFEDICGIAANSHLDIHEIEARKQRGEELTATEEILLMRNRDREYQQRRRQNMTEEEQSLERQKNRERKQRRKQVLLEAVADGFPIPSSSTSEKRADLSLEKLHEKRTRDREYRRNRRKQMSDEQLMIEKEKDRERKRRKRNMVEVYNICENVGEEGGEFMITTEEVSLLKQREREYQQRRRQNMTEEQRALERQKNRERKRLKRLAEKQNILETIAAGIPAPSTLTPEKRELKRVRDREYRRNRRKQMTEEQLIIEKQKDCERKRRKRSVAKAYETLSDIMANIINSHI